MPDTGKRADWTYRAINMAMSAGIALGVGWVVNTLSTFSKLPEQVSSLKVSVDKIEKAQAGFATGEQVGTLRRDVDTLTGRVDTIESTVNSLVKPVPKPR